ncbi:hypothetical protein FRC07_008535 [Ceratobasidium sp. 392]|nr:hypothetical protein FRC07_008535 [Ceratobasidium sp. 392]
MFLSYYMTLRLIIPLSSLLLSPPTTIAMYQRLSHTIMHLSRQTAHREFAERFTHAIILSPLLSNTSPSSSPPNTSTIPHHPITLPTDESDLSSQVDPVHAWPLAAGILVLVVFITSGFTAACIIALIAGLAHATDIAPEHHARQFLATACGKLRSSGWLAELEDDPAPMMLAALDRCVQAASAWDSVVSEAVGLLEVEERTLFYSSSPPAPAPATSALRVALASELNAATNTTDTLRGLFAPLTQPAALAPLAAMYAPPTSPPPVRVRSHARYASIGIGSRTPDTSPSPGLGAPESKRSTWGPGIGGGGGGKFSTGANYGNLGLGRRRTSASMRRSRLATPDRIPLPVDEDEDAGSPKVVSDIGEDSERLAPLPQFGSDSEAVTTPRTPPRRNSRTPHQTFGSAALSSLRRASHSQIQTTSLAAIRHALTVARSSRRHTAAHLMALRFADGDGEYWEDVKSVMGLLSAGMEDAASRLGAAVESVQGNAAGDSSFGSESGLAPGAVLTPLSAGFAPTASPKERFAMHVEELVGAAGRAKELASSLSSLSLDTSSSSPDSDAQLEAVRRELGTALRQLERARAVLRQQQQRSKPGLEEEEDVDSDVPGLDGSPSSPASSEKGEELTPLDAIHVNADILRRDSMGRDTLLHESANVRQDDASAYLLLGTSAQHLPPPGIEQVFEADTDDLAGVVGGKRQRSTMSRADRIAAARAKREQKPAGATTRGGGGENWGPGGEVVQELKAVISEVGVRRRRAASDAQLKGGVPPSLDLSSTKVLSPSVEVDGES